MSYIVIRFYTQIIIITFFIRVMRLIRSFVTSVTHPVLRPVSSSFGSGPTKKRPGWTPDALAAAAIGRSHRSAHGKTQLRYAIKKTREVLRLPDALHRCITTFKILVELIEVFWIHKVVGVDYR